VQTPKCHVNIFTGKYHQLSGCDYLIAMVIEIKDEVEKLSFTMQKVLHYNLRKDFLVNLDKKYEPDGVTII
jgi:hypothetical protein